MLSLLLERLLPKDEGRHRRRAGRMSAISGVAKQLKDSRARFEPGARCVERPPTPRKDAVKLAAGLLMDAANLKCDTTAQAAVQCSAIISMTPQAQKATLQTASRATLGADARGGTVGASWGPPPMGTRATVLHAPRKHFFQDRGRNLKRASWEVPASR